MQLDATQKVILLTGASGKIGTALCEHLLGSNYNIIALTKKTSSCEELSERYSSYVKKGKFKSLSVDLCNSQERDSLISLLTNQKIPLYGLINNARSLDTLKHDENGHIERNNFLAEFDLGVFAPYDLIWNLVKITPVGLKRIINIASIYGVVATNIRLYQNRHSPLHYGVVKSALIHLTKELAVRLAENNITVNAISYGGVEGRVDKSFKKRYAQLCPQKNMLDVDDLAGSVCFLLSEEARSITGHNLLVDGGWTIW